MKSSLNFIAAVIIAIVVFSAISSFKPNSTNGIAYQYKQFTSIESVVPAGLGRSRIIISTTDGQDLGKDLLNFYSVSGINFKNIASNDNVIVSTIDDYTKDGWELYNVSTGVQSPSDKSNNGIYMTRYLFRKPM